MQTAMVVPSPPSAAATDTAAAKQALRRLMRVARKDYVAGLRLDEQAKLQSRLVDVLLPELMGRRVIAGYCPVGSEIDPTMLLWHAGNAMMTSAYPAFDTAASPMVFRSGTCAEDCPVGGVQPPGQAAQVEPDLILVPLLAADRSGNRLGQGGGHYDRALPGLRAKNARVIGVGWVMQLLDIAIPADPWDAPLDAFASPDGLVEFA
ncbi:MAG: 5-formyltetrahydrofolate cyclo-ligase [Pseudomonadota bacterium]|nr:5-formyltetrahydrofolate cyclo-ligase [Pseudomonadota bacterium]